jgi:hypothetical protein
MPSMPTSDAQESLKFGAWVRAWAWAFCFGVGLWVFMMVTWLDDGLHVSHRRDTWRRRPGVDPARFAAAARRHETTLAWQAGPTLPLRYQRRLRPAPKRKDGQFCWNAPGKGISGCQVWILGRQAL